MAVVSPERAWALPWPPIIWLVCWFVKLQNHGHNQLKNCLFLAGCRCYGRVVHLGVKHSWPRMGEDVLIRSVTCYYPCFLSQHNGSAHSGGTGGSPAPPPIWLNIFLALFTFTSFLLVFSKKSPSAWGGVLNPDPFNPLGHWGLCRYIAIYPWSLPPCYLPWIHVFPSSMISVAGHLTSSAHLDVGQYLEAELSPKTRWWSVGSCPPVSIRRREVDWWAPQPPRTGVSWSLQNYTWS